MKSRLVLFLLVLGIAASYAGVQKKFTQYVAPKLDAAGDTTVIPGGTLEGAENAGSLETTINGDTLANGQRANPNRVYALNRGEVYFQLAPIYFNGPTGKLTIVGVPSASGTTKPIIIMSPPPPSTAIAINTCYGSIKVDGVHWQAMQTSGTDQNELFFCGTSAGRAQSLEINNCLFEFSNIDLFDCTNETGAIGGWPYGAKFKVTNSYFRNMFFAGQWWGSRVYQCKHPTDTVWIENSTFTTGGLTFLQQNQLTEFMYINHNTIINNKKYWLLSPYHKTWFCTNNIFVNQNWVGEDTNVTNSGQDPDKEFMSTINVDTNNITNGENVQPKYWASPTDSLHFSSALDLNKLQIYISDNVNYYDPQLINGYYNSTKYKLASLGALPSYITWSFSAVPFVIHNVPGLWMNPRTQALFAAYGPGKGGMIESRTTTADPHLATPAIADPSVVDSMAVWNQNQWGDPRFPVASALTSTKYIYGDYDPTTLPGVVNGHPTDTITVGKAGISKFTDLTESFKQTTVMSGIDGLPVGSLIWDDAQLAAFNSAANFQLVYNKYVAEGGLTAVAVNNGTPEVFALAQNYPNPFNPSTMINFSIPKGSNVDLKVYNTLGQEVATLVHGILPAGQHTATFNAANLATGVYFYRLTAGDFTSVKKMMLVK